MKWSTQLPVARVKDHILPHVVFHTTLPVLRDDFRNVGLVLAAHDPAQLAGFYAALFGVDQRQGFSASHRCLDLEGRFVSKFIDPPAGVHSPRGRCWHPASGCPRSTATRRLEQLPTWLALGATVGAGAAEPLGLSVAGGSRGQPRAGGATVGLSWRHHGRAKSQRLYNCTDCDLPPAPAGCDQPWLAHGTAELIGEARCP